MVLEKANQQGTVGCFLKKKPFCQHIFQVHNHNFVSAYVTSKMDSWPNGNGKLFAKRQLKTLAYTLWWRHSQSQTIDGYKSYHELSIQRNSSIRCVFLLLEIKDAIKN